MKPKQLTLFQNKIYQKRKVARCVSTKQFMHIVMESKHPVLRQNHGFIKSVIRKQQLCWGIRIRNIAIQPDHIHLCVKISTRTAFFNFMRVVAGVIGKKLLHNMRTLEDLQPELSQVKPPERGRSEGPNADLAERCNARKATKVEAKAERANEAKAEHYKEANPTQRHEDLQPTQPQRAQKARVIMSDVHATVCNTNSTQLHENLQQDGAHKNLKTFWKERTWTRIVYFGKDLLGVLRYIAMNPHKAGIFNPKIDHYLLTNGVLQI